MRRPRPPASLRPVVIVVVAYAFLLPLVAMVLGSLRVPGLTPPSGFAFVPDPARPENYRSVFEFVPMWTYLRNTLIVVAVAVPVTVLVASWAGFAIASTKGRARAWLIGLSVVALMVPASALWVPRFVLFRALGLTGTLVPLMAPALMATTPFYVLLFALAYARLPRSLYEAAAVDGLSPFMTWKRVAWPLGRAVAGAVALLAFVFHWSNFVDALLYVNDAELATVSLGLRSLQTLDPTLHPILLAASVIVTVPALIAFFIAQRAFFATAVEA